MTLLGIALIIAIFGRPEAIEVTDDRMVGAREPRTREIPAPTSHVVTWAAVCAALAGGVVTLGVLDHL